MSNERTKLINNEFYHIITRGVGDSLIFKNKNDYFRAIFSLYEFNTTKAVEIRKQREKRKNTVKASGGPTSVDRNQLVKILAFCFMPNHIHLLLKQIKNDGISKFMRKFGTGYASYFNKKYDRMGHLFQGRFKAVHIKDDEQLKNVFVYIHTNPISLVEPRWKEIGIAHPEKTSKFLENYKWSSYSDYIGGKNFPSLTTERKFISQIMGGNKSCKEFVDGWIKYKNEIKNFDNVTLEQLPKINPSII